MDDFAQLNADERERLEAIMRGSKFADHACDLARGILALERQRDELYHQLAYYMPYQRMYIEQTNRSIDHSKQMMGSVLLALIDKDSPISIGLEEKAKRNQKQTPAHP